MADGEPRFRLEPPSRQWPLPFTVPIDSATGSNGRGMATRSMTAGWSLVSFQGVEEVDALGRVTVLAELDLWNHGQVSYPSSITRTPAGTILIGSGVGVVRLTPKGDGDDYLEDWLVPPACRETSIDDEELRCQCVGLVDSRPNRFVPAWLPQRGGLV